MKSKSYKYHLLEKYLSNSHASEIKLSFQELEEIIGESLPPSALKLPQWWYSHPESQSRAWENTGYRVKVDLEEKIATFTRQTNYWTFFCNPKYWDIKTFLIDLGNGTQSEIDSWRISDHHKDLIKKGDYGVIRVGLDKRTKAELNGDEKVYPGVYAIVKVLDNPYFEEELDESNYWNDSEPVSKRKYKVKIEFLKNFIDSPIYFEKYGELLKEDKYLVKGFQASSMPLLPSVFDRIMKMKNLESTNLEEKDFLLDCSRNLDESYIALQETEKESIVKTRIGQNLFKRKLMKQSCKCKICGLDEEPLLIASHIKPWKDSNNFEKLDIYNGFLLCPNHDKLFDSGLISFDAAGLILVSDKISEKNYSKLNIDKTIKIEIFAGNLKYLAWHRDYIFKLGGQ